MASVYKRDRDKKRKGTPWYFAYKPHDGPRRTVKGYTDKAATEALAHKLELEADLRRRGQIDPQTDAYAAHEARLLRDHLEDWHSYLVAKGATRQHAMLSRNRARRTIDLAHAVRISDLSPSKIQAAIKSIRDKDLSLRSIHHYTRAVKGFSRWLWRDGRARADSLAHLTSQNPDADRRHERRALEPVELIRLIGAAEAGPVVYKLAGPDRAMLYRLAMGTGFRANELRSLTPESFNPDDDPPTIIVRAAYSKRRRDDVQPIQTELAQVLLPWLRSKPPGKPLFANLTKHTADMLRIDLEAAGIPYRDASGRFADFHALRHSYVTALAKSNAPVKIVQTLARHSTPTLTLGVYSHIGLFDQTAALDALPDLSRPEPESEPSILAATGTDSIIPASQNLTAHLQRAGSADCRDDAQTVATPSSAPDSPPERARQENKAPAASCRQEPPTAKRRGWDSNPRTACTVNGFQDRPDQPLWHPS